MVLRVEALRERLAKLEEVVSRLREVGAVTRDDFLHDYRRQWLAERGLELAAQPASLGSSCWREDIRSSAATTRTIPCRVPHLEEARPKPQAHPDTGASGDRRRELRAAGGAAALRTEEPHPDPQSGQTEEHQRELPGE